jgi:hypothetical protein
MSIDFSKWFEIGVHLGNTNKKWAFSLSQYFDKFDFDEKTEIDFKLDFLFDRAKRVQYPTPEVSQAILNDIHEIVVKIDKIEQKVKNDY